ncbi:MAG: sulfurtransferase [Gorillibacterium sp.]|nr:sulfurtransferase [Gorillibacterium sp.]
MSSIVSMQWVKEHMNHPDVVLVDCRFVLGQQGAGRAAYETSHLPGAVYFDLEEDLSSSVTEHGGRHPLPEAASFIAKLGAAGIGATKRIIAYDDQGGAMACRFWWLLRYYGHRHTVVMDQGFSAWEQAGYALTSDIHSVKAEQFIPHIQEGWLVTRSEVLAKLGTKGTVMIDSRDPNRYAGREETIDPIAGHIPSALNHFWKESMDESGHWKPSHEQRDRFADLSEDKEIIVYCGSGVTACPNVLALKDAGYPNVKLYAGSWSDWITYEHAPIATGEE